MCFSLVDASWMSPPSIPNDFSRSVPHTPPASCVHLELVLGPQVCGFLVCASLRKSRSSLTYHDDIKSVRMSYSSLQKSAFLTQLINQKKSVRRKADDMCSNTDELVGSIPDQISSTTERTLLFSLGLDIVLRNCAALTQTRVSLSV